MLYSSVLVEGKPGEFESKTGFLPHSYFLLEMSFSKQTPLREGNRAITIE